MGGTTAAMEKSRAVVTGANSARVLMESDYQMLCASQRRLTHTDRNVSAPVLQNEGAGREGAGAMTVLLKPALAPNRVASPSGGPAGGMLGIREYLDGASQGQSGQALALRNHEISARQWRSRRDDIDRRVAA